ncbi:MAG: hypothetical protein IJ757_01615 [Clostridiales bacterium]|nr:hypothetical protein [Clostridiales bacterium]
MEFGFIPKVFYIGRYLYLTRKLDSLPTIRFSTNGEYQVISITGIDTKTGTKVRKRIASRNKDYEKYKWYAQERQLIEEQLRILLSNWKSEYKGDLKSLAREYELVPDTQSVFNTDYWNRLSTGDCNYQNTTPVFHNGILMRSQFEADVAQVIDELGIRYKYDVKLIFPNKAMFPDFALDLPEYNRCSFIETMGGMDNFRNQTRNAEKLNSYFNVGLYPNIDLGLICGDYIYRPDHDTIKKILGVMLDALGRRYVIKKSR